MFKRKINRVIGLLLCFVCLIIWAEQPVSAENEKTEILIGAHLPLSGALAMAGVEQKWAYEKAVEDINKAGGIYVKQYGRKLPVRLVVMDDETNPQKATEVVEELIKQTKVDLLLSGHSGAHGVLPGLITAEKYHKYYHGTVVWVPDFLDYNFKWGTMYFFDMAQGGAVPFEIWNSLPEDQRPQKPALFMEDTFDGKQMGELLVELAEKYGYKIATWESMGMGAKDFLAQIQEAKSIGVDAILLLANTEDVVTLVRQMKELNFNVKFFHGWKGTWATEFYKTLGKDAEYIFCDGFWSEDYPFPKAKELGERYYKEHGKHSVSVGMYYALCQTLWQGIERAGTLDSASVRQAILGNEFDTVNGKVDYDERGIALFPSAGFQWWKGKQQIIYPFENSKFEVKIAPPWDKRDEKTEILIGAHLPLSGAGSLVGAEQKWAYEKAVENINIAGGIYVKQYSRKLPVHLVVIDDESDPIKAAEVVEQLITQTKVDLLLSGQVGAMGVIPGMITAEKYKKYYHGTVIWVPDFLEHNFKWCTMYFFDIPQGGSTLFETWNSLPEVQRPKRPALFVEDSTDGEQIGGLWAALAEKYGYEITMRESIAMGSEDYSSQIIKAKSIGVDAILFFGNVPEAVTLIRQMKKIDFNVKFFYGMKGTWATEFYEALGKDADYILCDGFWSMDYPFAGAKELGESFYKDFKKYSVGAGMYYAVCQILWQGIEKAGTLDSAEVRQAVLDNKFDTVMGKVDYDERGIAFFPLAEFQWWNGKQEVVYPFEYSKFKIKVAPTWDKR